MLFFSKIQNVLLQNIIVFLVSLDRIIFSETKQTHLKLRIRISQNLTWPTKFKVIKKCLNNPAKLLTDNFASS